MNAIILVLCIAPLVRGYDLAVGLNNYGKKIFDESRQASPAIWRQKENVTIEAAEHEIITKVIIIDMRPEKDGDARIIDGGEGKKSVTIELKSPTVFRGYDFHIFVYSAPENQTDANTPVTSSEDYKLHTNAINTDSPLMTTINPLLKDNVENKRPVRTAEINGGESISSPGMDISSNSPGNLAFGSAVSFASTNTNEAPAARSTTSFASATSTADTASGSFVSEAASNSSVTSPSGSDLNTVPFIVAEGAEHKFDSDAMNSTAASVPISIGYEMNEGTSATPEENMSSTAVNYASEDTTLPTTLIPYMNIPSENTPPDLNTMKDEGTRSARRIEEENVTNDFLNVTTESTTTTMSDIINENSTEAASVKIDGLNNKDMRHSRGITDIGIETDNSETTTEFFNETSTDLTTAVPEVTEINDEHTQVTTDSIARNDVRHARDIDFENFDINETTTILDTPTTTEVYNGDGDNISDILDLGNTDYETNNTSVDTDNPVFDLMPGTNMEGTSESDTNSTASTDSNEPTPNQDMSPSIFDQMWRNPRDAAKIGSSIFEDNSLSPNLGYNSTISPILVDSSHADEQTNSSDYVYIPIIAMVSKTSYPLFQEALKHLPGQGQVDSNITKSVS